MAPSSAIIVLPAPAARPKTRRAAFTLVELLVVIGIIALLISILLPALGRARRSANAAKCLVNLRSLGMAQVQYVADWRGWAVPAFIGNNVDNYPGTSVKVRAVWFNNNGFRTALGIEEWVPGSGNGGRVAPGLVCPDATQANDEQTNNKGASIAYSYGYNSRHVNYVGTPVITLPVAKSWVDTTEFAGVKADRVRRPVDKIMFADSMTPHLQPQHSGHYTRVDGYNDLRDADETAYVAYRHGGVKDQRINVVFWDGHAEAKPRPEIEAVIDPNVITADGPLANRTEAWTRAWELQSP